MSFLSRAGFLGFRATVSRGLGWLADVVSGTVSYGTFACSVQADTAMTDVSGSEVAMVVHVTPTATISVRVQ